MQLQAAITSIGSSGVFPSRAFLPAFTIAMGLRFGHAIPFVAESSLLTSLENVPHWFTHDLSLCVLGVLSIVELAATKSETLRESVREFQHYAGAVVSFLVSFGLLNATDAGALDTMREMSLANGLLAVGNASGVFVLGTIRKQTLELLSDFDPDNTLGLQRWLSWIEDFTVVGAVLLLLVFPLLMIVLSTVGILLLSVLRRILQRREESLRIECAGCRARILPGAVACHECHRKVDVPCSVGFFGQFTPAVPANPQTHALRLLENRRCPVCASRLPRGQVCRSCNHAVFSNAEVASKYTDFIDRRRFVVLPVCIALSLVPIIGVLPGIIYYRLMLVAPYQRHLSRSSQLGTRWLVRGVNFLLLSIQWIPVLGGFSLPLMATTSHLLFRSSFRKSLESGVGDEPVKSKPVKLKRKSVNRHE
ncbi:MAG: hypothetical protein NT069_10900 [Planctomycetota bacterium]|nr:hypothetical protein [Planctomycetota bacterium]